MQPLTAIWRVFQTADRVLAVLPDVLGADGPRRYLIALMNLAENRPSGGAPLSVALLTTDDGKVTISDAEQVGLETFPGHKRIRWDHVTDKPFASGDEPQRFINANLHPDFRLSGEEMLRAWNAAGKPEIDGVIGIDTTALGAVLSVVGPIDVPELGEVNAENATQKLLIENYESCEGFRCDDGRIDRNSDTFSALADRLLEGPDPIALVEALSGPAAGRHLQVYLANQDLNAQLADYGIARARPRWLA